MPEIRETKLNYFI